MDERMEQDNNEEQKMLNLVQSESAPGSSMELGGLQEELEKIKRDQDDVLRQLEASSSSPSFSQDDLPPILQELIGTWKTVTPRDPTSASHSYFPPAFLFNFMWYKVEGHTLHCIFFNGMDHEKQVDAIGVECDGAVDGSRKMTFLDGDRIVTSHRMVADGSEYMRIERFIENERLHFVFRMGDGPVCTRIFRKAFRCE